jgi:hypothetical protein
MKTVMIASIPEREGMLKKTVNSLLPQVDNICVALNNYDHIPEFLWDEVYTKSDNRKGDSERYWCVEDVGGYLLTCDDDLIYPANYVNYMIRGVEKYNCACSLHGRSYPNRPIENFQSGFDGYPCLDDVMKDVEVDIGGTGVMCWHTDFLKVRHEDFQSANMADIWFSKLCHEQNVKIMCLNHREGYLKYQYPEDTIWDQENLKGFVEQTKLLKTFLL